jgi:hypothetical protein
MNNNNNHHHTDCDRPACDDMMNKLQKAAQAAGKTMATKKTKKKVDCPLGTADLGRSSWGLLHSMVSGTIVV